MSQPMYDQQESRLINTVLGDVPHVVDMVESSPAICALRDRLREQVGQQSMPISFAEVVNEAVEQKLYGGFEMDIQPLLARYLPKNPALLDDTVAYVNVLHGVNALFFAKVNSTLGTSQNGDPSLPQVRQAFAASLQALKGMGEHTARQLIRDIEARIDQTMARCMGVKGR